MTKSPFMFPAVIAMAIILIPTLPSAIAQSRIGPSYSGQPQTGLVPLTVARSMGLERAWIGSIAVDTSRGRVASAVIQVSRDKSQSFPVFEVTDGHRTISFSSRRPDAVDEAHGANLAEIEAEVQLETLKALGREASMEKREIPDITLYAQTNRGIVQAIDASSGRTRWSVQVGNPNYPNFAIAASQHVDQRSKEFATYVAAINGIELYLINGVNGDIIWQRKTRGVPTAGPAVGKNTVFVPVTLTGVEAYSIDMPIRTPRVYGSTGAAFVQPSVSPFSVSWPTEGGFLYVAKSEEDGLRFRLPTSLPSVCPTTRQPPYRLFSATTGGTVHAVHELSGNVEWTFSTGERISQSPLPIADSVYVVTRPGNLYSLNVDSGLESWMVPRVKQVVSCSDQRVYCLDLHGDLVVLDVATGSRLGRIECQGIDFAISNSETDRLYLGTRHGLIQCLHEQRLRWPMVHVQEELQPAPPEEPVEDDSVVSPPVPQEPDVPPAFDPFSTPPSDDSALDFFPSTDDDMPSDAADEPANVDSDESDDEPFDPFDFDF